MPGLEFSLVPVKAVRLDWESWDLSDEGEHPLGRKGYDFIMNGSHDTSLDMPKMYRLCLEVSASARYNKEGMKRDDPVTLTPIVLTPEVDRLPPIFLGKFPGGCAPFVTEEGKYWLDKNDLSEWLEFRSTVTIE